MKNDHIKTFAPATVANVSCGFDILGFAIETPGDEIEISLTKKPGVKINSIIGDNGKLPLDPKLNSASVAIQSYINHINYKDGVEIILHKKMPISSGLGSSAASSVAAAHGINNLLGSSLNKKDLLPFILEGEKIACGSAHADNAAASLLGGFILVRNYDPLDIIQIDYPEDLIAIVIHPNIEINTKSARGLLDNNINLSVAVSQWGNIAGLITGLHKNNYGLISRSLNDYIAEPKRSKLIKGFDDVKEIALKSGAIGCGISGSGPSMFALNNDLTKAKTIATSMQKTFKNYDIKSNFYISKINPKGAIIIN